MPKMTCQFWQLETGAHKLDSNLYFISSTIRDLRYEKKNKHCFRKKHCFLKIKNIQKFIKTMHKLKCLFDFISVNLLGLKLRLHTAINRADFVSRCMLYTYKGNKMHS